MINKLIHISYQPISEKYYTDYYIGECIEKGIDVEYWDISNLYFPKLDFINSFVFSGFKKIQSFRELKERLSKVDSKSAIFITNITYEFKVWRLFLSLSIYNCTLLSFGRGMFPTTQKTEISKIRNILMAFDLSRIITGMKNRIATMFKRFKIVKTCDYIFCAGSEGYNTLGYGNKYDLVNAKIFNINYFDYDKYLESNNGIVLNVKNYCVFLDEYLPYHPDFKLMGIKTISADSYFSELNKFFEYIENKFNISVVIAAHPKAFKYKIENPFDKRPIIFDKTCELVKEAAFVMTHYSSSISYPILFQKPILFLNSQSIKITMPSSYDLINHLGNFLNCEVINFDNINDCNMLRFIVDLNKYNDYKYKYLTSKASENRKSSDIFIETISKL